MSDKHGDDNEPSNDKKKYYYFKSNDTIVLKSMSPGVVYSSAALEKSDINIFPTLNFQFFIDNLGSNDSHEWNTQSGTRL